MNATPDALTLGPLVLGWGRLALVAGLLVFLWLVGRGRNPAWDNAAWWAVILGVLAGRLAYGVLNWDSLSQDGLLGFLGSLVDIRSGGLVWPLALAVGGAYLLWRLRRDVLKLAPALLLGALAVALPLLLRPVQASSLGINPGATLLRLEPDGSQTTVSWSALPKPLLVNVWATWCPPCRAEMPLLAEYIRQGYPIVLLNAGESQGEIRRFLSEQGLGVPVYLSSEIQQGLGVSGLPTSLTLQTDGGVINRHLGALNRAQLRDLLEEMP